MPGKSIPPLVLLPVAPGNRGAYAPAWPREAGAGTKKPPGDYSSGGALSGLRQFLYLPDLIRLSAGGWASAGIAH